MQKPLKGLNWCLQEDKTIVFLLLFFFYQLLPNWEETQRWTRAVLDTLLSESERIDGSMDEWEEESEVEEEREDSYLHPRRLVYKSSPERREETKSKQTIKDAATVNTCSQTRHQRERERERLSGQMQEREKTKTKQNRDERKTCEGRREKRKREFSVQVSWRSEQWTQQHQKHFKLLQKKKRTHLEDRGWTCSPWE